MEMEMMDMSVFGKLSLPNHFSNLSLLLSPSTLSSLADDRNTTPSWRCFSRVCLILWHT